MLRFLSVFFFIVIASTLIYILSLHDALPICVQLAVLDDEPALDTQPLHLLDHVPSERVIPHPGDHAGSVTQPRRRDGDVHGAASEELAEAVDVLEPLLDLQGVDVDATASEGDDVEVCCHGLHASCIGTWIGCRVLLCDTAHLMH